MKWLVLLMLAGCGSGNEVVNDNHGYGFAYDAQANGMKLRYTPVLPAGDPLADVAFYQSEFASVEQCSGISASPPFIILVEPGTLGTENGLPIGGLYFNNPILIVIGPIYALRHEFIHYLLDRSTGDMDATHKSPLFNSCL